MNPTPDRSMERPRAALAIAKDERADALVGITLGNLTMFDVITAACLRGGESLLMLGLRDMVEAQPQVRTRAQAVTFLRKVAALLETETDLQAKKLSWLVDPRSGGRRLRAFVDASMLREAPWPGFPHTPGPDQERRAAGMT